MEFLKETILSPAPSSASSQQLFSTSFYVPVIVTILLFITFIYLGFSWIDTKNEIRFANLEIKMYQLHHNNSSSTDKTQDTTPLQKQSPSLIQTQKTPS